MQQTILWWLVPLALAAGAAGVWLFLRTGKKQRDMELALLKEELKNHFAGVTQESLRNSGEQLLTLAAERFGREHSKAQADLAQNRIHVENSMGRMSLIIEKLSQQVKEFESDRSQKYGSLQAHMEGVAQGTGRLQQTVEHLSSILGNVKLRGQWGERMAEDILRVSGLVENIHYRKNKAQDTLSTRPDYVFLLPNDWKICMDVKFPLNNYLAYVNCRDERAQEALQAEFIRDVKNRIKEITRRDYIHPDEQTLDCVLLFIPNEQVYGFIHEAAPGLLDEAMRQKVILCSPFTLYAVLAVVRQSFDIFHFKKAAREILTMMQSFGQDFEKFKSRFADMGKLLEKASDKYHEITETSYKRLDSRVRNIDDYRKGNALLTQMPEETAAGTAPADISADVPADASDDSPAGVPAGSQAEAPALLGPTQS